MVRLSFGFRRRDEGGGEAAREVAAVTRAHLALADDSSVTVSEIACGDPECGGAETVILIGRPGRRTEAVKVRRALSLVSGEEVRAALDKAGASRA